MQRRALSVLACAATLAVAAAALSAAVEPDPGASNVTVKAARPGGVPTVAPEPAGARPDGVPETVAGLGPRVLLPDVRSLPPEDLQIRTDDGRRELRFAALLANDGAGPLVVRPQGRRHCAPKRRHAAQVFYVDRDDDGRYQRRRDTVTRSRPAGCMLDHPSHDHWHFDAMASYALVDMTPVRRVVVARNKVSFCLRDNRPVPGTTPRQRREYFGECGPRRVQGISPGWVDVYDVETPGQSLRLPRRLPNGAYCLVLRADPRGRLVETDEDDNVRARAVRIRGTRVRTPSVRTCRGAAG